MGPRPDGRGTNNPIRLKACLQPLQWGRGRMAAERAPMSSMSRPPTGLQWGRGRMAAERGPGGAALHAINDASMGPRPDGRGTR